MLFQTVKHTGWLKRNLHPPEVSYVFVLFHPTYCKIMKIKKIYPGGVGREAASPLKFRIIPYYMIHHFEGLD